MQHPATRSLRQTLLVALVAFATAIAVLPLARVPGAQAQAAAPLAYDDPVTDVPVSRLTTDGPNGCVNYMGNLSGEADSWSPDSSRIAFAKACDGDTNRTGVHVFDRETGEVTCVARTGRHWAYPIFDHDGDTIFFVDGSDGARNDAGAKPYVVRTVEVPNVLDGSTTCPDASAVLLDIRAASNSQVRDAMVVTRNAATSPADELFGVQVRNADGQWRTVLFDADGSTVADWGFDDRTNPVHDDTGDGDASIWSPVDPFEIFTNRGTSADNASVRRGVWTVESPTLQYEPFAYDPECSGDYRPSTGVAHSDWAYHAGSDTHIFLSSDRCPWLIDGSGDVTLGPWRFFGYLHLNIDPASLGASLGDVRFVADEYFDGYDAEPFLYSATLGDVGVGSDSGFERWSDVRRERKLVGHRNRMDDGSSSALKAYEPHPQFSPDGRSVLWQSSSLTDAPGYPCPAESCGNPGSGEASNVGYLDLYVADLAPFQVGSEEGPITDVPRPGEVTVATSCLASNGRIDVNIVGSQRLGWEYTVEIEGLSPRSNVVGGADFWRTSVTGRPDGDYDIRVTGDRVFEVLNTTVTIACDDEQPTVHPDEVQLISACIGFRAFLLFQLVNPSPEPRGWVIEFEGVPNRSTSAAGLAQSVRGVSGRPDGTWAVRIRTNGIVTHDFSIRTNCESP